MSKVNILAMGDFKQEDIDYLLAQSKIKKEKIQEFMKKEFGDTPFFLFYEEMNDVDSNHLVALNGGCPSTFFKRLFDAVAKLTNQIIIGQA